MRETSPIKFESLENRTLLASGLSAAYFARTNLTLARYSQTDAQIDMAWANGTPHAALGTDGFSVRWTGQILGKFSETYTFTTVSTGGVRLWVNNFLIIDSWQHHDLQEDSGSCRLTAGKLFDLRLEYWNDGTAPEVQLDWESARLPRMTITPDRFVPEALDKVPPTAPTRLRAANSTGDTITLIWDPATDPSGVVNYDVYVGSTKVANTLANQLTYTRNNLTPNTGYVFSVQAMDAAGNTSALTTTAVTTAAPADAPPSTPTNVRVTSFNSNSVTLEWNASSDDKGVTGYRIYRNGVKLPFGPTGTTFIDTTVSANTNYTYSVRAADNGGNFSGYSDGASVTTSGAVSHNPYSGISAVNYNAGSGVNISGNTLTNLSNNDWIRFDNVNFGSGANSVEFDLALDSSNRGGTIELRLGGVSGTLIGTHFVPPTGSSSTFRLQRTNISNVTGTHNLFLVFKNSSDVARLRNIKFSATHLTKIMPLGDSITEGAQNPLTPTYRYYLWQLLNNAGYDVDFVGSKTQAQNGSNPQIYDMDLHHEGYSGWTADQIAAQAEGWVAAQQPEIVILHIGTNDLHNGQSVNSTLTDIENIIDNVRNAAPNVTIILAQILPLVGHIDDVNLLNAGIAEIASEMNSGQSPIRLVDLNTGFSLDDLQEGIHAKPATESQMASRIYSVLSDLLQ